MRVWDEEIRLEEGDDQSCGTECVVPLRHPSEWPSRQLAYRLELRGTAGSSWDLTGALNVQM